MKLGYYSGKVSDGLLHSFPGRLPFWLLEQFTSLPSHLTILSKIALQGNKPKTASGQGSHWLFSMWSSLAEHPSLSTLGAGADAKHQGRR